MLSKEKGWVSETVSKQLTNCYEVYRSIEHRLQMINDAQTHELPKTSCEMERIACLDGITRLELEEDLLEKLNTVHRIIESFFSPSKPERVIKLSEIEEQIILKWPSYPALRSSRAENIFNRLKPKIISKVGTKCFETGNDGSAKVECAAYTSLGYKQDANTAFSFIVVSLMILFITSFHL